MKKTIKQLLFSVLMSCLALFAYAQQRTITGTVMDETGSPIPGVSYIVVGTPIGGITDESGAFSVAVTDNNAVLEFSFVGFQTKQITIADQTVLNVVLLKGSGQQMEEVVVTALGIRRASKSLGYAVQEVKGETLAATRELNVANALSGQVAGLQVIKSSNGPGASSKIILRGFNSLTGDNQPLVVVDGVPISNFTGQSNSDYWNPSLDMGNGLSDLNAEDIASISVLKGPSAAALYGTRAGNGVILITTKTGRSQRGVGITISSSVGFERPFMIPDMQSSFGQGNNGIADPASLSSWGPKIGSNVTHWDSTKGTSSVFDNVDRFLRTGIVSNQNISLQQLYKSTSVYASYNRVDNLSMIPGAKLIRNNITTRMVSKFINDKMTFDAKVQYNNTDARNRPLGGPNVSNNAFAMLYLFPRSVDITGFRDMLKPDGTMQWFGNPESQGINPYWAEKYRLNNDVRDRFIMNGSVKYDFTEWLTAEIRAGADMYTTNSEAKTYGGSPLTTSGRFSMGKETFRETNYSSMITAKKDDLLEKLGGSLMIGGNLMNQVFSSISGDAGELEVPNLFSLNNGRSNPGVGQGFYQKKINSLYGAAQLSYDEFLFLDATFRNDWSSTFSPENRSFFYPSISTSLVFSELMERGGSSPTWFSYGKLRASYAFAGNDLGAYELYNTYWIGKDPNGVTTAGRNTTLYNDSVKNELIRNIELGTELRFFQNRLGIDFTYYKSNAFNQLLNLPMDPLSGYSARKVNAGNIQNQGIELVINGQLFRDPEGFSWNTILNVGRNKNKIIELSPEYGITEYTLGGFDNVFVKAIPGGDYGDIQGAKYLRVTDESSPYYDQLLLNSSGLPQLGEQRAYLGNQQAKALVGWTNNLSYKNVSLSFLIDGRFGGQIFSGTSLAMQLAGTAANTVVNGDRQPILVEGVQAIRAQDGTITGYQENTTTVTPQVYWQSIPGNLGYGERNIYDATNVRLRNIQLNYQLPQSFVQKTAMQSARIGISCNNVWMLKSHMNGIDPESVFATGTNAVGFENLNAPTSRTLFLNLSVTF